jgi:phosphoribosylformylglycinamidine synthase
VTRFAVLVEVSLRPGIADPQGATIERALPALGFDGISAVRAGKAFRFVVESSDEQSARAKVDRLCQRLLANPVIEDSVVTVQPEGQNPADASGPVQQREGAEP